MTSLRHRRTTPSLRHRDSGRWTNRHAAVLLGVLFVLLVAGPVLLFLRQDRSRIDPVWPSTPPWDPSWPMLPDASGLGVMATELATIVYALVAGNEDTLQYVPCYCGCVLQGHTSVHHCHVKRRSADGGVAEWNVHGRMCPLSRDIAGDAVLWRQRGAGLVQIRADIEREYSGRGASTPTPRVPSQ
jgi:hypothetical protein